MTTKAGQKCTSIRRVIVPAASADAVEEAIVERLREVRVGDPADEATQMGPLASIAQRDEVMGAISALSAGGEPVIDLCEFHDVDAERGAFVAPTLLRATDPRARAVHSVEAFGPVATVIAYEGPADAITVATGQKASTE